MLSVELCNTVTNRRLLVNVNLTAHYYIKITGNYVRLFFCTWKFYVVLMLPHSFFYIILFQTENIENLLDDYLTIQFLQQVYIFLFFTLVLKYIFLDVFRFTHPCFSCCKTLGIEKLLYCFACSVLDCWKVDTTLRIVTWRF